MSVEGIKTLSFIHSWLSKLCELAMKVPYWLIYIPLTAVRHHWIQKLSRKEWGLICWCSFEIGPEQANHVIAALIGDAKKDALPAWKAASSPKNGRSWWSSCKLLKVWQDKLFWQKQWTNAKQRSLQSSNNMADEILCNAVDFSAWVALYAKCSCGGGITRRDKTCARWFVTFHTSFFITHRLNILANHELSLRQIHRGDCKSKSG